MGTQRTQRRGRDVTARPKARHDSPRTPHAVEHGLSVDPEDLGVQFLNGATEQANFEAVQGDDAEGLSIMNEPPSDESLDGANFESEADVWENTARSVAQGQEDELRAPVLLTSDDEDEVEPDPSDEVDLTRGNIREASLLDRESNALGEVDAARPKTDESGPRAVVSRGRGGR